MSGVQVTARHGTVELQRTVVARNASLRRCLADFCGLELVPGVHCPRFTLCLGRVVMQFDTAWKESFHHHGYITKSIQC